MNVYCISGNLLNAYARAGYAWVRWIDAWAGWNVRMGVAAKPHDSTEWRKR